MKPVYADPQTNDLSLVRREIARLVQQLGDMTVCKDLGDFTIGIEETPISHGLGFPPKRWAVVNMTGLEMVCQTKSADARFLYLTATTEVRVGIVVF